MMGLATLDIVIFVVVLLSAFIGLVRGLVKEVLSIVAWIAALVVAVFFSSDVGGLLPETWGSDALRQSLGFILLFVGSLIMASVIKWLISKLVESTGLSGTDRFLGFLFGSARGLLVTLVLLIGLEQLASDTSWWQEARLPGELLAFEDELRKLFGQAQNFVEEDALKSLEG